MTDEEIENLRRSLQKQINTLAKFTGQALAAIVFRNPEGRAALEYIITHWEGITYDDVSKTAVLGQVRDGIDLMTSASRTLYPDPKSDD